MGISKKTAIILEGRFTKVARAFAKNDAIRVRLSGTRCDTTPDGTINLPANADYLTDETADLLEGLLDHEWAHQYEETEAKAAGIKNPFEIVKACKDKRERLMLNVVEDIRIELKQARKYVGVAENLSTVQKHTVENHVRPMVEGKKRDATGRVIKANPWWIIGCAFIARARGFDESWIPGDYRILLDKLADEVAAARAAENATDSYKVATSIIEKLKALGEEAEGDDHMADDGEEREGKKDKKGESKSKSKKTEKSEKSEGGKDKGEEAEGGDESGDEGGDGGEEGEGSGSGSEDGEEGEEEADDSAESSGAKKSTPSSKEMEGARKLASDLGEVDPAIEDLTEFAKDHIEYKAKEDIETHERYMASPGAIANDKVFISPKSTKNIQPLIEEVRPTVGALRSKMLQVLMSQKERHVIGDQERGRIDASTIYGLRFGNKRIFTKLTKGQDVNTAVLILVDQSGSMGDGNLPGQKAYVAKASTLALSETLDKLGIPFSVVGFSNAMREYTAGHEWNRIESLDMEVFKSFEERFNSARSRYANITGHGNNTDGDALLIAAKMLAARPERRKILIVLSDGFPCAAGSGGHDWHLEQVVPAIMNIGIEVAGIGIMSDAVKKFYTDWAVVNDIADLAPAMFKLMKKYLLSPLKAKGTRVAATW